MLRERLVEVIENLAPTPIAWFAIVVGVFVHFIGFFLFKIELPEFSDVESPEPYVSFVKLDESDGVRDLRAQALLSDSVSLFLPSEFDYGWEVLQPSYYLENQNSDMLEPYRYSVSVHPEAVLNGHVDSPYRFEPQALLASDDWESFRTLGETPITPTTFPVRFATMEFAFEGTYEAVKVFNYSENPIELDLNELFWKPAEVMLLVGVEGSLGSPYLQESTGVVALDHFVVDEAQRIGNLRLIPEGYYRVTFGP